MKYENVIKNVYNCDNTNVVKLWW